MSGPQLIERLSSLEGQQSAVRDRRKKYQQGRRQDDWRTRTLPVTLLEIQEADRYTYCLLAHLSHKGLGLVACCPHSSNISETTGPIKAKFHVQPPWDGGMKVCSTSSGYVTKMAALSVFGKTLKKYFSLEPTGQ